MTELQDWAEKRRDDVAVVWGWLEGRQAVDEAVLTLFPLHNILHSLK